MEHQFLISTTSTRNIVPKSVGVQHVRALPNSNASDDTRLRGVVDYWRNMIPEVSVIGFPPRAPLALYELLAQTELQGLFLL
jgi:hypothetical protein